MHRKHSSVLFKSKQMHVTIATSINKSYQKKMTMIPYNLYWTIIFIIVSQKYIIIKYIQLLGYELCEYFMENNKFHLIFVELACKHSRD